MGCDAVGAFVCITEMERLLASWGLGLEAGTACSLPFPSTAEVAEGVDFTVCSLLLVVGATAEVFATDVCFPTGRDDVVLIAETDRLRAS